MGEDSKKGILGQVNAKLDEAKGAIDDTARNITDAVKEAVANVFQGNDILAYRRKQMKDMELEGSNPVASKDAIDQPSISGATNTNFFTDNDKRRENLLKGVPKELLDKHRSH